MFYFIKNKLSFLQNSSQNGVNGVFRQWISKIFRGGEDSPPHGSSMKKGQPRSDFWLDPRLNKQLLDEVFVICRIINVEVRVISRAEGEADNSYRDIDNFAYHKNRIQ